MNDGSPQEERGVEKVTLDDVLKQTPLPTGREVGPLTRIGYNLAKWILLYLAVVTGILLLDYLFHAPSMPKGDALTQAQLDQCQQLSQIATERTTNLLDTLVLKGFLPVFTAVLGYIFGTRGVDKEET